LTRVKKTQIFNKTPEPQVKQKKNRSSEKKPAVGTLAVRAVWGAPRKTIAVFTFCCLCMFCHEFFEKYVPSSSARVITVESESRALRVRVT